MPKITDVRVLDGYRLALTFNDGFSGTVDLSDKVGKGVFALWNDIEAFRRVQIGSSGELLWSDQVDLCPDSLYLKATGKKPDEVFPALRTEQVHA